MTSSRNLFFLSLIKCQQLSLFDAEIGALHIHLGVLDYSFAHPAERRTPAPS